MHIKKRVPLIALTLSFIFLGCIEAEAQAKYYRIRSQTVTAPNWRDTIFVVKVSHPAVQAMFEQELAIPWLERTKIINGTVVQGDGGFNRNGTHCFNWHYDDNESIELADLTTEVCDGWPYQDCELSNFPVSPGHFCPWSMRVWDEIGEPQSCTLDVENPEKSSQSKIFPNPASDYIKIRVESIMGKKVKLTVFDPLGTLVYFRNSVDLDQSIPITELAPGLYLLVIDTGDTVISEKFLKI